MAQSGSNKKVSNRLVAWSSAAILAVYSAGYDRTKSAANRFELLSADRMPARSGYEKYRGSNNGLPANVALPLPAAPIPGPRTAKPEPKPVATADEPNSVVAVVLPEPPALSSFVAQEAPAAASPKTETPLAPAPASHSTWKDGTYLGWGTSRHGDIQAAVVIEGGRIASATISQCRTRYSCSVIDRLPPEVAQRQSPEVDYVSGATQSANAFYYAVVEALAQAK
jgi:uncharacterized protein with FMN-binding domain